MSTQNYQLTTTDRTVTLLPGNYSLNLSDIPTPDPSDYWQIDLLSGKAAIVDHYSRAYLLNQAPYSGYLSDQSLTIFVRETTELNISTEEGWSYPYNDTPTNPTTNLNITDLNPSPITTLNPGSITFEERQDYVIEEEGQGASVMLIREGGTDGEVSINIRSENGSAIGGKDFEVIEQTLVFADGENHKELEFAVFLDGLNEEKETFKLLISNPTGDATIGKYDEMTLTIEANEDKPQPEPEPITLENLTITGFAAASELDYTVGTGGGDRAASSLGRWIMGDSAMLKQYGTEGSALHFDGLTAGSYELDWSMLSKDKYGNADTLYAWNGKTITELGNRAGETQRSKARWTNEGTVNVDVIYNDLYIFAMDAVDKRGTTEFTVEEMRLIEEAKFVPEKFDITNNQSFGHYRAKQNYIEIGSSSRDRAVSSIARELGADLDELTGMGITEGSLLTYTLPEEDLKIELTWQYRSRDADPLNDKVLVFDKFGTIVQDIDLSRFQNIGSGRTFISERQTLSLSLDPDINEFTIGVFDVGDKSGTSYVRVNSMEMVAY